MATRPFSGGKPARNRWENPHCRDHDSPRTASSVPGDITGPPGILSNGPTLHGANPKLSISLAVDQRVVEVAHMERRDRDSSVVQGGPANIASTRGGDVAIQRREVGHVNPNKKVGQDAGSMVGLEIGPLNKINPLNSVDLANLYPSFVSHGPPLSPTMIRAPILGHDSGPLQENQIQDDTLNLDPFRDPSRPPSEPSLPPNFNWVFLHGIWTFVPTKFFADSEIGPNHLEGPVLLVEGGPVPLGVSARISGNGLFVGLTSRPDPMRGVVYGMRFDPIGGSTLGPSVGFDDIVRPQTELSQGTRWCGRPKKTVLIGI